MTQTIKGNLVLEKDTTFNEGIIVEGHIFGKNGERYNLAVNGDISAFDISAKDISAWDISAVDISARDISYFAFCIAYYSIKCRKIEGRRKNSFHKVLDGKIEIIEEVGK